MQPGHCCFGYSHPDIEVKYTKAKPGVQQQKMKFYILLIVLIFLLIGLSANILPHPRSSTLAADTCTCLKNSVTIVDCSTASSSRTSTIPHTRQSLASRRTPLNKREPVGVLFHMGRHKSYYELNPEKATDHLYDIQDENTVGHEIVKVEAENIMAQIWHSVRGSKKDAMRTCA